MSFYAALKQMWYRLLNKLGIYRSPEQTNIEIRQIRTRNYNADMSLKLAMLSTGGSTVEFEGNNKRTEYMKQGAEVLEKQLANIAFEMMLSGECLVMPQVQNGIIAANIIPMAAFEPISMIGNVITHAAVTYDYVQDKNGNYIFLVGDYRLDLVARKLYVNFEAQGDIGKIAVPEKWLQYTPVVYSNVDNIGFGYFKSPRMARMGEKRGVPLLYGCKETLDDIKKVNEFIARELDVSKATIFTDSRNTKQKTTRNADGTISTVGGELELTGKVIPIASSSGQTPPRVITHAPDLRLPTILEYKTRLEKELECQAGLSPLITPLTSGTSTATEITQGTKDTGMTIANIHTALNMGIEGFFKGLEMLLTANGVPYGEYNYKVDYDDPYETGDERWKRMLDMYDRNAADELDLRALGISEENEQDRAAALDRVRESKAQAINNEIDRMLNAGA